MFGVSVPLVASWLCVLALGVALFLLNRRVRRLEVQYRRLLSGVDAGNLEQILNQHLEHIQDATAQLDALRTSTDMLGLEVRSAIRHVGIIRFNPFADTGGDLSFAVALADAQGDGVVLCNLHGRGESRTYAKPLVSWGSPYSLSHEEMAAVQLAREPRTEA